MRTRDTNAIERSTVDREERVSNADDRLGDNDSVSVLAEQVIHIDDRASVCVLDGNDGRIDARRLERVEDFREGAARDEIDPGEQRRGCGLREGAGHALIRDAHDGSIAGC